ncbi:hypothetical protein [Streptomyces albidochromogenes]|uniref:hypothetical protein n=1 Tax=Streptomyces albidochromogenes TaxID=329524 RepID=UPI00142ECE39|nr:hypothetical protein [Streptomyces albidochromogenes]
MDASGQPTLDEMVFAVMAQSRIRRSAAWAELDFVEQHVPKYGWPPETIEEYRAQQLQE